MESLESDSRRNTERARRTADRPAGLGIVAEGCCHSDPGGVLKPLVDIAVAECPEPDHELIGIEASLLRAVYYNTEQEAVTAVPFANSSLDWNSTDTLTDGLDSANAAVQLLGCEHFAWLQPHLAFMSEPG